MKNFLLYCLFITLSIIVNSCEEGFKDESTQFSLILKEVTAVPSLTSDNTPDYTFSSNIAGTIKYGGSCSSSTTTANQGNNKITLDSLSDGTYSDCTITVDVADSTLINSLTMTTFTVDSTAETLLEVTAVTTPTNDTTPDYTFSTNEAGTITYGGSCSSSTTSAIPGNNTITLNSLSDGTYSDCTITITNSSANSITMSISSFVIDTTAPTVTQETAVTTPTNDTTPNYTFSTNEAGTITYGGSCSSSTTSAISGNNPITLNSLIEGTYSNCTITVTDSLGHASSALSVSTFVVDTTAPSVDNFTLSDYHLKAGETATVRLVFSEVVASFEAADITVDTGTLASMTSSNNITWTGTFTPTADEEDAGNTLSLATSYTDTAGNTGTAATTLNYEVDTLAPSVISFTLSDTALKAGETATVELVFSEAVASFSAADINLDNATGTLPSMTSSDNITWTGTFTPTANREASNTLSLATSYTDTAGNAGPSETTANYEVDTLAPSVSSFTLSDTALKAGDNATVELVFSEAVASFSAADINLDNATGTLPSMTSSDNITWTGTFTPTANREASNTLSLATSYTDTAGNTGPAAATSNYEVDTTPPSVISFTISPTALKAGGNATVTLVFSEAVAFFSAADITVANGTLGTMTSSNNITWTGTFTPTADTEDASNTLSLKTSYTDTAGNAGPAETTANYEVDTLAPSVSSFTLSATALKAGDTATVELVFSEAVASFSAADINLDNATGTLPSMTSSDNITWTGTFTPTANREASNTLSLATSYTDTAGNAGPSETTANYEVDTLAPSVSSFTLSDTALKAGDNATVELVFSEAVIEFSAADINLDNATGTLPSMTSSDNITWTGTFTRPFPIRKIGPIHLRLTTLVIQTTTIMLAVRRQVETIWLTISILSNMVHPP